MKAPRLRRLNYRHTGKETVLHWMILEMRRFSSNESGATAIEYGLIASLVGVAIIVGAGALGTSLNNTFKTLSSKMK